MKPIKTPFTDSSQALGWGREGKLPLAVENDMSVSTWELSDEDRERVQQGGRVALAVDAHPQPAVLMEVVAPFCESCEEPMGWSEQLKTYSCPHEDDPGEGVA